MSKTLGDLSATELIEGADRDVRGLLDMIRKGEPTTITTSDGGTIDLLAAYEGSIRARLSVALGKL